MAHPLTIALNNVRFRAYHGLYPEERQKGNDFVVNLSVMYEPDVKLVTSLEQTIDYGQLFRIIDETMQKPVDLLETLVQSIAARIHKEFPAVLSARVSVEKLNPPIDGFSGSSTVTCEASWM